MDRPARGFLRATHPYTGGLPDKEDTRRRVGFREWQLELRNEQVRYVSLLTGFLYFVYAIIELRFTAASELGQWQMLRALGISALLSVVALLSFRPALRPLRDRKSTRLNSSHITRDRKSVV